MCSCSDTDVDLNLLLYFLFFSNVYTVNIIPLSQSV